MADNFAGAHRRQDRFGRVRIGQHGLLSVEFDLLAGESAVGRGDGAASSPATSLTPAARSGRTRPRSRRGC